MEKHYNIPVFLPELACPFRCVYCNQSAISGHDAAPSVLEMRAVIESRLSTIPIGASDVEIAFFGGNFTGLPTSYQEFCLRLANSYMSSGRVKGIRISTRPDFITQHAVRFLKQWNVRTIELGAQSLDDEVLVKSGRGHNAADVHNASDMIRAEGLRLGLQMMIGLPGDSLSSSLTTAQKIIEAGADETRIYPCLVIADTELEEQFKNGIYQALPLQDAIEWSAELYLLFERAGVKVIRMGLFPSDELRSYGYIAGPFHPAFKELVMTHIWKKLFEKTQWPEAKAIRIEVPVSERNFAIGYQAVNKKNLSERYEKVSFHAADLPHRDHFTIHIEKL